MTAALTAPALPPLLDLAGIAVFALTGALLAARLRQTFVTMVFFALVTGVGGGSVRDLLIGAPVFWVRDPWVAPVIPLTALIAWLTPSRWWTRDIKGFKLLDWADAVGLAGYAVLGTAKALSYGVGPVAAMLMGVMSGCVGGIVRDVLAGRPSILMRPELYVTAAALAGFGLRGAALIWNIELPPYSRED